MYPWLFGWLLILLCFVFQLHLTFDFYQLLVSQNALVRTLFGKATKIAVSIEQQSTVLKNGGPIHHALLGKHLLISSP